MGRWIAEGFSPPRLSEKFQKVLLARANRRKSKSFHSRVSSEIIGARKPKIVHHRKNNSPSMNRFIWISSKE